MSREGWVIGGVSVVSLAHAVGMAATWDGDAAAAWQTVLYGAEGSDLTGPLAAWEGLFFPAMGPAGAALSLAPFHLLAAWGLWRGGTVRGGAWGGVVATALVLANPAVTLAAAQGLPAFAAMAVLAGALACFRIPRDGSVRIAGLAFLVLAQLPFLASSGLASGTVREVVDHLGPATLGALLSTLLLEPAQWDLILAGLLFAPACVQTSAHTALMVVPLLACFATHRNMAGRIGGIVSGGIVLAALAQLAGQHSTLRTWPAPAASFRPVPSPAFDFSEVVNWLEEHADGRVGIHVPPSGPLHVSDFTRAAAKSGFDPATQGAIHPTIIGPDYPGGDDLGIVVTLDGTADPLAAWIPLLPTPSKVLKWPGGFTVALYDHALPAVVSGGTLPPQQNGTTPSSEHPANQSLYVLLPDGTEQGPLLTPCSSPDVIQLADGWHAYFVQGQQIYHATGDDGLRWNTPSPLGIHAVDPAIVRDDGGVSMLAAVPEEGTDPDADPAGTNNELALFVQDESGTFQRDEMSWMSGLGLVDPIAAAGAVYFTEGRDHIGRFLQGGRPPFQRDASFRMDGVTVPALTPDGSWMVAQRHVATATVLYAFPRVGDRYGEGVSLEVCGTGAAIEGDRIYYTRADDAPCGRDAVDIARRKGAPWVGR